MSLGPIPGPGDFPFGLELFPRAVRQGKLHRDFCSGGARGAAFDKKAASAYSAGQAIELFSLWRGVADFDCESRPGVCAAMGEAGIVVAGEEAVNDLSPWYSPQEVARGVVNQDIFMFSVNGQMFSLMASELAPTAARLDSMLCELAFTASRFAVMLAVGLAVTGRVPAAELANATVVALDPSRDALEARFRGLHEAQRGSIVEAMKDLESKKRALVDGAIALARCSDNIT